MTLPLMFRIVRETLPDPPTIVTKGGVYTNNMVNTGYQQDHNKVLDQMRKAFLINFLPGEL